MKNTDWRDAVLEVLMTTLSSCTGVLYMGKVRIRFVQMNCCNIQIFHKKKLLLHFIYSEKVCLQLRFKNVYSSYFALLLKCGFEVWTLVSLF